MKLNKVTITGADDSIDPRELSILSKNYPFVEWGILFSDKKQGVDRYPSLDWISKLLLYDFSLSAHLCGKYVSEACSGNWYWTEKEGHKGIEIFFNRIQLNFARTAFGFVDFNLLKSSLKDTRFTKKQFIFGHKNAVGIIKNNFSDCNVVPLFDGSGGKGIISKWVDYPEMYCGYAGGLNPDNLDEQLESILKVVGIGDNSIWIDVESGVRTNNKFDLEKVENFLDIASSWV